MMIDQTLLPFEFKIHEAKTYLDTCHAVRTMIVRGAGAIGAAAGYAMAQAFMGGGGESLLKKAKSDIESTRPTAQNLFYATNRVFDAAFLSDDPESTAVREARKIADEDADSCKKIGEYGNELIRNGDRIETHCNAGWLAFVDHGTALSPIFEAKKSGKDVFVYVDETSPRYQGARLTAWELKNEGVPYAILPDTAGADLMEEGRIDMVIVGADRIARNGDAANKIGTMQKAIVANHFGIPFYVAAPASTFDMSCPSGKSIPIEERSKNEVLYKTGMTKDGRIESVLACTPDSQVINRAFDVTPAGLITGIITEKGIIRPREGEITKLFS